MPQKACGSDFKWLFSFDGIFIFIWNAPKLQKFKWKCICHHRKKASFTSFLGHFILHFVLYFHQAKCCTIIIVHKRFLWELCNRWLIHVKHIRTRHGLSLTSCLTMAVSSCLKDSEIYNGMNDGDYEYLALEVGRDRGHIKNRTFRKSFYPKVEFESECWSSLRKIGHFTENTFTSH